MFVTASPGTGSAGLCASRLVLLRNFGPMGASPH